VDGSAFPENGDGPPANRRAIKPVSVPGGGTLTRYVQVAGTWWATFCRPTRVTASTP